MPHPARPKNQRQRISTARRDSRSKAEVREDKALSKFLSKHKDIITREEMAQGGPPPQGPYFYEENGKTFVSLPGQMVNDLMNCQHYRQMMRECAAQGRPVPHHVMAKDPVAHIMTPAEYVQQVKDLQIPETHNLNVMQQLAENSKHLPKEQQPSITVLEFKDFERPPPAQTPGPSHKQ